VTATEQQAAFRALRDEDRVTGRKRLATVAAYNAWFRQACAEGNPPDALQPDAGTDIERFFARTIPGPDGHTYWALRGTRFLTLAGSERHPRWWWYEHVHGPHGRGTLASVCGERNCITPDHQLFVSWAEARRRFTDERLIGSLQTVAIQLGHAPNWPEYRALRNTPSAQILAQRFGSWERALTAAGLEPSARPERHRATADECFAALRFATALLGHAPTEEEFRAHNLELRAAGLHSSPSTIYRCLGSWPKALRQAGL
jgi:hypothetical protein